MKGLNYYKRKCFVIIASYGLALNACVIANFITGNNRLFLPLIAIILVIMEFEAMSYTKHKKELQKRNENKFYTINMKNQTLEGKDPKSDETVVYDLNKYIITFSSSDLIIKKKPSKYVYFADTQEMYINTKADNEDIELWSSKLPYFSQNGDADLIQIANISMENLEKLVKGGQYKNE